jgi:hypothetical protein
LKSKNNLRGGFIMAISRKELEFVIENNKYLKGGTKEACVKVRQVLKNSQNVGSQFQATCETVSSEEFMEAIQIIMAATFQKPDEVPDMWRCDSDCKMTSYLLCPGECNLNGNASKMCPHFMDEQYV